MKSFNQFALCLSSGLMALTTLASPASAGSLACGSAVQTLQVMSDNSLSYQTVGGVQQSIPSTSDATMLLVMVNASKLFGMPLCTDGSANVTTISMGDLNANRMVIQPVPMANRIQDAVAT